MKVFVLGGYGKVGLPAIRLLAQEDQITGIAVAGRRPDLAREAADQIGEKAVAVEVDGADEQKLTAALAGYDVMVNAADNAFVIPSIRAAIHNRAHYCDVAFGEVLDQARRLQFDAEAAGIAAILANGAAPSVSNLMGVHVARQLEDVRQMQLGFACIFNFHTGRELTHRQWLEDPEESLVALQGCRSHIEWLLYLLQENGGRTVCDHQEGKWVAVDPIRNGVDAPLFAGGTIKAYPYASIDPPFGALPTDLSTAAPVEMSFSSLPAQLHRLLRENALRVLDREIDSGLAAATILDTVASDPHHWLTSAGDPAPVSKMWVRAVGCRGGRPARCTCWLTAPILDVEGWHLTSVALVVAVLNILRGESRKRGVMIAEKTFEPRSFFDDMALLLPENLPDRQLMEESFDWL